MLAASKPSIGSVSVVVALDDLYRRIDLRE
jgi:hypothetical protein